MNDERDRFIEYLARLVGDSLITEAQAVGFLQNYDDGEIDQLDLPLAPDEMGDDSNLEQIALLLLLLLRGKPFPQPTVPAFAKAVDTVQDDFEEQAISLADQYSSGAASVSTWQKGMLGAIATYAMQQIMLGNRSVAPGREQLARFDVILREEAAFLSRFADRIAAGSLIENPLSDAQIAARSILYGGTGRGEAFRAGEQSMSSEGWIFDYISRDDRYTCYACTDAARRGPYLANQGPMPGQVCLGRSRCRCVRLPRYDLDAYRQLLQAPVAPEPVVERTAQNRGIRSRMRVIDLKRPTPLAETTQSVPDAKPLTSVQYKPSKEVIAKAIRYTDERIAAYAASEGVAPATYKRTVRKALSDLMVDKPIQIQVRAESIDNLLAAKRFKSQFETGTSSVIFDPEHRARSESNGMGLPVDLNPTLRPVYGYVKSFPGQENSVGQAFGNVTFVLRDEIRERVGYTVGDSLNGFSGQYSVSSRIDTVRTESIGGNAQYLYEYARQKKLIGHQAAAEMVFDYMEYVEVQVRDGVNLTDIARVVDRKRELSAPQIQQLRDLGIQVQIGDD